MKNTFLFAIFWMMLVSLPIYSQVDDSQRLISCISKGDMSALSKYFDPEVEISILGKGDILSAKQAESALSDFFSGKLVSSCKISHQGNNGKVSFCIITLTMSNREQYRVYVLNKKVGEQPKIQQFRIDYVD